MVNDWADGGLERIVPETKTVSVGIFAALY